MVLVTGVLLTLTAVACTPVAQPSTTSVPTSCAAVKPKKVLLSAPSAGRGETVDATITGVAGSTVTIVWRSETRVIVDPHVVVTIPTGGTASVPLVIPASLADGSWWAVVKAQGCTDEVENVIFIQ